MIATVGQRVRVFQGPHKGMRGEVTEVRIADRENVGIRPDPDFLLSASISDLWVEEEDCEPDNAMTEYAGADW